MAINNTYVLEVDLKRQMTGRTPSFRKGDNGILIFKIFDDGIEYDISSVNKAELYHKTSNGNVIKSNCDFINFEGQRAIRYVYEEKVMIDVGRNETLLVVYENNVAISIQPFPVIIYSDLKGGANSLLELIQSLQNQINSLILDLNSTIKQSEKGKPNGVATLDATGKIPLEQLPPQLEAFKKHIPETIWKNQVHGMRIDKDGIMQYDTGNNTWQNVGFATTAIGGGSTVPQLLDANITKSNSTATVTYVGVPTVQIQKWAVGDKAKTYFVSSGTTFTGNTFAITQLGIHTLYYKDSNGMEYVKTFNVATSDLTPPTITVNVNNGDVTVNIVGSISVKKWAKGQQTIGYFQSQGTVFTGNTFKVAEAGWYTIYYKTTAGVEYVYEFEANGDVLLDATITMNTSPTQHYLRTYKNPQLINNSGGTVTYTTKITDSPIPEAGNVLNTDHRMDIQRVSSLIPSDNPLTLYYHFTLKKGDLTKTVTEPIKFGYHTSNSTSTLASLSAGDLFRIDGYNDGHFMKINSGSSNVQVIHISTSDMLDRKWGIESGTNYGYGFQLDNGIGQFLNNDYYNQLPSTLRNSIINYDFKLTNSINNQIININAKVGFIDEAYALSQDGNINSNLAKSGAITHTVMRTRQYPDYVLSYGTIDVATLTATGQTLFRYASNFGDKSRQWWHTPMFVIGSASNVTVRKLTNTANAITNQP